MHLQPTSAQDSRARDGMGDEHLVFIRVHRHPPFSWQISPTDINADDSKRRRTARVTMDMGLV